MTAVDVAVIGGGIAGVATAAFLAEGGLRVRLHERAAIAAGASGRNSGIVQHPFDPVLAGLYRRTLVEYRALAADPGSAAGFGSAGFREPAGLLYIGHDGALARQTAAAWEAAWPGSRPEVLEGRALRRLEPALAPGLIACRLAIGFPVAPAAATRAFAGLAERLGVELVVGGGAVRLVRDGDRVTGVERDGRIEAAGAVVVAAGPWSAEIVDPSGGWRPIRAAWGVVASLALADAPRHGLEASDIEIEPPNEAIGPGRRSAFATAADEAAAEIADERDAAVDFSLVPAIGSSALGSTFLPEEPDPAAWLAALRRVGARYVPGIAAAPLVGLRHCARPVSVDGRPLVGAVPGCDGLWLIAGHGPWGISTGPGSARLLADRILGRADEAAIPAALAPGRFGPPVA